VAVSEAEHKEKDGSSSVSSSLRFPTLLTFKQRQYACGRILIQSGAPCGTRLFTTYSELGPKGRYSRARNGLCLLPVSGPILYPARVHLSFYCRSTIHHRRDILQQWHVREDQTRHCQDLGAWVGRGLL
jgi:hypothetical protein